MRVRAKEKLQGTLVEIESEHALVSGEVADNGEEIMLRFDMGWPVGITRAKVRVVSDEAGDPACLIHCVVSQAGEIEVIPPEIQLTSGEGAQSRMLFVKSNWGTCGELTEVRMGGLPVVHRVTRANRAGEYRVFVDFPRAVVGAHDAVEILFEKGAVAQVAVAVKRVKR